MYFNTWRPKIKFTTEIFLTQINLKFLTLVCCWYSFVECFSPRHNWVTSAPPRPILFEQSCVLPPNFSSFFSVLAGWDALRSPPWLKVTSLSLRWWAFWPLSGHAVLSIDSRTLRATREAAGLLFAARKDGWARAAGVTCCFEHKTAQKAHNSDYRSIFLFTNSFFFCSAAFSRAVQKLMALSSECAGFKSHRYQFTFFVRNPLAMV